VPYVSYVGGETPVPGDYVKNQFDQPGTVTRIRVDYNGDEFVSIRVENNYAGAWLA
jgi:hypothetical protein